MKKVQIALTTLMLAATTCLIAMPAKAQDFEFRANPGYYHHWNNGWHNGWRYRAYPYRDWSIYDNDDWRWRHRYYGYNPYRYRYWY
jgi:hypothetical protein